MIEPAALPAPLEPEDEWAIVMSMAADGEEMRDHASDLDWRTIEVMAGMVPADAYDSADLGPAGRQ